MLYQGINYRGCVRVVSGLIRVVSGFKNFYDPYLHNFFSCILPQFQKLKVHILKIVCLWDPARSRGGIFGEIK